MVATASSPACFLHRRVDPRALHTRRSRPRGDVAAVTGAGGCLAFTAIASLGLPGWRGFWGEVLALLGSYNRCRRSRATRSVPTWWPGASARADRRLLPLDAPAGEPRQGPAQWEGKKLVDVQPIEMVAWAPLLLLTLGLGLYPRLIFDVTTHSVIGLTGCSGAEPHMQIDYAAVAPSSSHRRALRGARRRPGAAGGPQGPHHAVSLLGVADARGAPRARRRPGPADPRRDVSWSTPSP